MTPSTRLPVRVSLLSLICALYELLIGTSPLLALWAKFTPWTCSTYRVLHVFIELFIDPIPL